MGFGVLDTKDKDVPGTALLTDDNPLAGLDLAGGDLDLSKLKYGTGKNAHIVLVPQPSDDPNDPLNWSAFKKWSTFAALLFAVTLTGVAGPLLSPATLVIADQFNLSLAKAGQATVGWQIFGVAVSVPLWGPIMNKIGRRLPFVLGGTFMLVGGCVVASAKSTTALIAGRAIIGIGMGPAECLAGALIGDMFFVHQRGLPLALLNLCFINGINLSPSVAGVVTARHGWNTAVWIFVGFTCTSVIVSLFLLRETLYIRKPSTTMPASIPGADDEKKAGDLTQPVPSLEGKLQEKSYAQTLNLWSGVYSTNATFFQMIYRPLTLLFSPIIWFAFLGYGLSITFIVLIAVLSSYIFSLPPYNFGPEQSGYIWFASFIGTLIAAGVLGQLSDLITKSFSRRNKGIFEPEFRLPLMALFGLLGGFGYLGWGVSLHNQAAWIAPVVSFGLIGAGMTVGLTVSTAYLVDSFGAASASALTAMMTLRNFVSFSATYWASPWLEKYSVLSVFATIAGIHFAVGLLTIPMYIFGKKARSFTSRHVHFRDDVVIAH